MQARCRWKEGRENMLRLLDRLYEKDHVWFAVGWIVAYVVLASEADALSLDLGVAKLVTAPVLMLMSVLLWAWVRHARLEGLLGLRAPMVPASRMLWYLPLAIVAAKKLFFGVMVTGSALECLCSLLAMCFVGFIEELVFRGLLFRGMDESNHTSAVVVSSITFGIGHIVNLFNATAQDLVSTLAQIAFAVAVGFAMVYTLLKSGSIWPCVIFHSANNALGIFENEAAQIALFGSTNAAILAGLAVSIPLCVGYVIYLMRLPDASQTV